MREARAYPALIAALVVAGIAVVAAAEQPRIGQEAPDFSLPSLAGKTVGLSAFEGRFVVLHFGAGW